MPSHADRAREFEVLIRRAARLGYLDITDLLDTYVDLAPSSHPRLLDERRVDIHAVTETLQELPPELLDAPQILVVPSLDAYPHEPAGLGTEHGAGLMEDGTLLIEARLGLSSLMSLGAQLCLLQHEIDKAQKLLPESMAGTESDEEFLDSMSSEPTPGEFEAEDPTHEEPAPEDPTPKDEAPASEFAPDEEEGELADSDASTISESMLTHVAFAWGTDPETLMHQNATTGDNLWRLLAGGDALPEVFLHADLGPQAYQERGQRISQRIASTLAEMGLLSRPLHLWIGPGAVTDCLSPYCRDLRDALQIWANAQLSEDGGLLGEDLHGISMPPDENQIGAIAHDFIASDPRLHEERERAERSVGLLRHRIDDVIFETIDLARIEPDSCDSRIIDWHVDSPAPVILRLGSDPSDSDATVLRALLESLGPAIVSITVVLEGTVLTGPPGSILLPHMLVRWAGEEKLTLPTATTLDLDSLQGFSESTIQHGAILSAPSAALLSQEEVARLRGKLNVAAVNAGGEGVISALSDALWSGVLPADSSISWSLVSTQRVSTGRPSVNTIGGLFAVAIAKLRELGAPPHAPTQQPTSRERLPISSRPTIRIKA